jgi:ABC-type glycerol-3-phosphate transport system substrate-binding protein
VRFQWSVPEPTRIALMNSLAERFNQSQKDFAVAIEYVPQAQARQKLISAIASGSPRDLCQVWDNWVGQFNSMGAVEDINARAKSWKHYADVAPTAWQTVTINDQVVSLPLSVTLDGIYYRTDRLKELGFKEPTPDWTWDEFLKLAQAFTKADKNQYGYGMRGTGTWALLYPSEFAYANGAEVLKDGKVVINSKEAIDALSWYIDLALKHKVTPPSAATDGFVEIVETFGRGDTSMYQHNSGSSGQQKKNVGADNFATLPVPIGARARQARLVLVLRNAHHVQGRQEQGRCVAIHELYARRRTEPQILLDARPLAGAQVGARSAGICQGPGAGRLRQFVPHRYRQPLSRLPGLGRQDRLRWRAADPAGDPRKDIR